MSAQIPTPLPSPVEPPSSTFPMTVQEPGTIPFSEKHLLKKDIPVTQPPSPNTSTKDPSHTKLPPPTQPPTLSLPPKPTAAPTTPPPRVSTNSKSRKYKSRKRKNGRVAVGSAKEKEIWNKNRIGNLAMEMVNQERGRLRREGREKKRDKGRRSKIEVKAKVEGEGGG